MTPMTGMAEPESRTVVANRAGDTLFMRDASKTVVGQFRSVDSRSLRSHIDISAANLVKQFGVGQDSASNSTCYENPAV